MTKYRIEGATAEAQPGSKRQVRGWILRCLNHDDREPSLSLQDFGAGAVWKCHAGCNGTAIKSALLHAGIIRPCNGAADRPEERTRPQPPSDWMRKLWDEAIPLEGTPASAYLRSRHIRSTPRALRWHHGRSEMLAQVIRQDGSKASGLHRTRLPDRRRRMNGRMAGGAIRLARPLPTMAIAEGIETALSFGLLYGIPCWSAISASGMAGFDPPTDTTQLVIAADHDGPGLTAAEKLVRTLGKDRPEIDVQIMSPPTYGVDWNDVLQKSPAAT